MGKKTRRVHSPKSELLKSGEKLMGGDLSILLLGVSVGKKKGNDYLLQE